MGSVNKRLNIFTLINVKAIHYGEYDCTALFCEMLSLNT